ncbi:MAG: GWxTD domain-containing protein [Deferribacteres bacterium]|nr:GWxTD domain-containing protein [Deferribacteres bacterium]
MKYKYRIFVLSIITVIFSNGCSSGKLANFKQFYSTRLDAAYRIIVAPSTYENKIKIRFIAEVKYKDLLFVRQDSLFKAELRATFSINPKKDVGKTRLIDRKQLIEVAKFSETIQSKKFVRFIEEIELDPDEYTARIMLADGNAKNIGLFSRILKSEELKKSFFVSDPIFVKDSLAQVDDKSILPLSQKIFTEKVFAYIEIKRGYSEKDLKIHYDVRDHQREVYFKDEINTSCDSSICEFWLPLSPEKIAVGASSLHVIVHQGDVSDSTMANLYAQYNFSNKKLQNVSYLIEPMRLIMQKKDWKKLKDADEKEQTKIFKDFWDQRNPNQNSEKNLLLEEFFQRVEEANQRFRYAVIDGWRTDRGRIYLLNGHPDVVRQQFSQNRQSVYEIWEYRELGVTYYFRDDYGTGDYRLLSGIH